VPGISDAKNWAGQHSDGALETVRGAFTSEHVRVAVVAIDADGSEIRLNKGTTLDARFEIGSVTKTMTATLLASLIGDAQIGLGDPVGRWLAAGANAGITLEALATHTAGLPRLAPNQRALGSNPYRNYTAERAETGLRRARPVTGAGFAYSNFGYQLLGLVLERATARSYRDLLTERLLTPLVMTESGVGDAGGGTRVTGYAAGRAVPHWDHALPGPGGVEMSVGDLGRYLLACLSPPANALGSAIRLAQTPRVRIDEHREIGLGWMTLGGRMLWHNGGTGGFSASVGIDRETHRAIGIMVNVDGRSVGTLDRVVTLALADPHQAPS
jgi:CubicO group peptidase (beta-lactamase class C family)